MVLLQNFRAVGQAHSVQSVLHITNVEKLDVYVCKTLFENLVTNTYCTYLVGGFTKAQSTLIDWPNKSAPFKLSIAACASLKVSYSMRA